MDEAAIRQRHEVLAGVADERVRRLMVAAESLAIGRGGQVALARLVEPTSRGDPESPLRWTCKSVRKLAVELKGQGHQTSHRMVAELLHDLGYSRQVNQKTLEGSEHPDRNAQFEHLNGAVQQQLWDGEPTISVDTKKERVDRSLQERRAGAAPQRRAGAGADA